MRNKSNDMGVKLRGKWLLVSLLAAPVAAIGVANYNGVCVGEWRKYSDEELLDLAIRDIISSPLPSIQPSRQTYVDPRDPSGKPIVVESMTRPTDPVFYTDIAEFKEVNKDCCRVARPYEVDYPLPGIGARLSGTRNILLLMNYKQRYRLDGQLVERESHAIADVSNCGCIVNRE